ncbi:hypothetical protein Rt10032_c11g4380 [Rhodotorula toruloides]|uniref:Arf-GAP domain-containing protein n=1 Tax=Rhodotorula toruloides TaxID=5286 RepID=A0A511KJ05_RHOTO|nr:hypothetical protein Rt10032_c11g4380 [Rhodotorula toruloides]
MSKTATDRYQRQLLLLLKEPGNDVCADCKARNPRKIGSHVTKVKSVTLDKWTKEQVENMRQLGNVKVNSMLNPDERRHPPPPQDSGNERNSQLERFIRNKYEYRTFAAPASSTNGYANDATAPPTPLAPATGPYSAPASSVADSVPPLPRRPTQPAPSAFADFSAAFGPLAARTSSPQPLSSGPALPPRPPLSHVVASAPAPIAAPAPRAKSVRFPEAPPTFIPSPPDSDDAEGDDDSYGSPPPRPSLRPHARSASAIPPRKGILRFRPGGNDEILVDWAALTSPSPTAAGDGDEEDVPLASLGALGMRGAQVGMAAVPAPQGGGYVPYPGMEQQHGMWAVPYGRAPGPGQGGPGVGQPPVAPLQPQYTGSAKGYLHQQRLQQQALQPQQTGTGIDAFQQLLQPRAPSQPQQPPQPPSQQPQHLYSHPRLAQPQARTNPFHAHLKARNAYSPSPQPPSGAPSPQPPQQQQAQQQPQRQLQQGQTAQTMNDIWADLDLLGGSSFTTPSAPQPPPLQFQAPSHGNALAPSPSQQSQPNPPAPAPLRPQLTGFVPSSSFGQQLARESSPFPPSSSLAVPSANAGSSRSSSPAPFEEPKPLRPQRTGFVPSSAFGQELARDFGGGAGSGAPSTALAAPAPAPLQPQRTGFVPSSRFGLELAKESGAVATNGSYLGANGAAGEGRSASPAPFDFAPSPALTPQPPATNPFSTFSASLNAALPPSQPPPPPEQHQSRPNPFLQPQLTGFGTPQTPLRPQQTGYFPRPPQHMSQQTLTGFQSGGARPGGGGGGNPFLAFGAQNGGTAGWQRQARDQWE